MTFITVNGNWGAWSNWTNCTKSCGGGIQNRTRRCDDPKPRYGGAICTGNVTELNLGRRKALGDHEAQEGFENQICNEQPCPSMQR